MERTDIEPVSLTTPDLTAERLDQLRELFPEAFTEGKVDFDKLRAALGDFVDDRPERYSFNWAGKRDAIRLLQTPSSATLVPVPEESVNWDTTQNIFIEGDNLEVLKLLYKPYFGKVKLIYIDPPYNTGNDFVYPDDFSDPLGRYLEITGQKDAAGNLTTSNPETSGRYHSAWLTMMYPRLFLARQLLREDGVIFISIDDTEVHNLRLICDEIFGGENFITTIAWQKKYSPQNDATYFSTMHDYILVYAKTAKSTKNDPNGWQRNLLPRTDKQNSRYKNLDNDPRGPWKSSGLDVKTYAPDYDYPITTPSGRVVHPPKGKCWRFPKHRFLELAEDNRIWFGEDGSNVPSIKRFLSEVQQGIVPSTWWTRSECGDNQEATREVTSLLSDVDVFFDNPKPVRLIENIITIATQPVAEDIVMDFFAGSCTTAHAVLSANAKDGGNRRFIVVQIPEPTESTQLPTIADVGLARIQRAIEKHGFGSSPEGRPVPEAGVKAFRLVPSVMRPWAQVSGLSASEYVSQMSMFEDRLATDWSVESLIYELALKEGIGLNVSIRRIPTDTTSDFFEVTQIGSEHRFFLYAGETLKLEHCSILNLESEDLLFVRDSAVDDTLAANLALQFRLKLI